MKREPEIWSNRDVMTLTVMAPVCVRGLSALCDETGKAIDFYRELDRFPNHAMKESYMRDILRKVTLCASL